jgi:tripartite-type tricarboxylate transporter receptor subunit TctC
MIKSTGRWSDRARAALLALVTCALTSQGLLAADYPAKPVSIVVPFPPGGSTDVQARMVARGLSEQFGKSVIIDNRPGAAGAIGARFVAGAEPDGHTLLFGSTSSLVTEPILNSKAGFDPLRDFSLITVVTDMPFLLVVSCNSPVKTVAELIASARAKPGGLNYSSWGYGSVGNVMAEMFNLATKIDVMHVPYKGEAPAIMGLLGGETSMMFVTPVNMPFVQSGKICPLAVTAKERLAVLPNVATFTQIGIDGMELPMWFGLVAPAKTPADIVSRVQKETAIFLATPEFARSAANLGLNVVGSSPEEFALRIKSDTAAVSALAKVKKLKE